MKVTDRHRRVAFQWPDRVRAAIADYHERLQALPAADLRPDALERLRQEARDTLEETVATLRGELSDWVDDMLATRQADYDNALDVEPAAIAHRSTTLRPIIDEAQRNPDVLLNALRRYEGDLPARRVLVDTADAMQAVGRTDEAFDVQWSDALANPSDSLPEQARTALEHLNDARELHELVRHDLNVWAATLTNFAIDSSAADMDLTPDILAYMQAHGVDIGLPDGVTIASRRGKPLRITHADGTVES